MKLKDLRRQATIEGGLPSNATLRELLDRWLEAESPRWKPRTLSDYRHLVDDVITPSPGNARLAKLTPDRIQVFYNAVAKRSVHEASYCHRVLHRALHVATLWGYLPTNPCDRVARPVYRPSAPTLWASDQVRAFLEAVYDDWLGPFFETALHRLADPLALPRIGLHKLRHLSASLALQGGIPLPMVSRRLGHSSMQVTATVYAHALSGDEQAADGERCRAGTTSALARVLAR